jgi:hypothetical protein
MFDKKAHAQALVLEELGTSGGVHTDIHGVDWSHYRYAVEVRPEGEAPFRVESETKVPVNTRPKRGDLVTVDYEHKSHQAEIRIEGDERYDPDIFRAKWKQERAAENQARRSGTPLPETPDERWTVPAKCPECGARVDQATAEASADPRCEYCEQTLPRVPVRAGDLP